MSRPILHLNFPPKDKQHETKKIPCMVCLEPFVAAPGDVICAGVACAQKVIAWEAGNERKYA